MHTTYLFKKTHPSKKVDYDGPSAREQLLSLTNNKYWVVLNSSILSGSANDEMLLNRANAFKHSLQTYGPTSDMLPDFRNNKGKANKHVYHGHVNNSNGTTYVLEWTIIDNTKKVMALVGFGTHENYRFAQKPISNEQKEKILNSMESQKIIKKVSEKIDEAKEKVKRIRKTYKNF